MVQTRNTIREQILEALANGPLSSQDIAKQIDCHVNSIKHIRLDMVKKGQIKEVGAKFSTSFGTIKMWGLVDAKLKAKNAFDWRNWEPQAKFSSREIAYSNSQFANRVEKRVIVYSRA
jgi:hypothetical protein